MGRQSCEREDKEDDEQEAKAVNGGEHKSLALLWLKTLISGVGSDMATGGAGMVDEITEVVELSLEEAKRMTQQGAVNNITV
ncbi:GD12577 [Drosophila simulans]|uniref:GD12577 n=1 Tax=Drosophila simulans TaxID=7240 RepID=B4QKJ9_DROSI|nr:GD12577 [Drosophila simulans]